MKRKKNERVSEREIEKMYKIVQTIHQIDITETTTYSAHVRSACIQHSYEQIS